MEIIKVEDNLRYAVIITNEEVENNGIITDGQFNPQTVMDFAAQIPEIADILCLPNVYPMIRSSLL